MQKTIRGSKSAVFREHRPTVAKIVQNYTADGHTEWRAAFKDHPEWAEQLGVGTKTAADIANLAFWARKQDWKKESANKSECSICGEELDSPRELGLHKHRKHGVLIDRKLPCSTCGEVFRSEYRLAKHVKETHPPEERIDRRFRTTNKNGGIMTNGVAKVPPPNPILQRPIYEANFCLHCGMPIVASKAVADLANKG